MSTLVHQLQQALLTGMHVPPPLARLYEWIESKGYYSDRSGGRFGYLFSPSRFKSERTDSERPGGTHISFHAEGNTSLKHWFGHKRTEVLNRLCVFARTGAEGSMAALWVDETGSQRMVHLGSGSGSTLVCVLADDPVDFLRLLAIGYDEICWDSAFPKPPNSGNERYVHPNVEYQEWVTTSFGVSIPGTATEIVRHPSKMGDAKSKDEFWKWVERNRG